MNRIIAILIAALWLIAGPGAFAQKAVSADDGHVYIEPLFTYPVAPDYLDNINAKSDYLMDNFWKEMNFKAKTVDQAALVHAFQVFVAPMRWASKAKVLNAVDALMKDCRKNPGLSLQMMRAAEETMYGARAEFYIDEVYTRMLQHVVDNKKIPAARKTRYANQLKAISSNMVGAPAAPLHLTDSQGNAADVRHGQYYTLYIFGKESQSELRRWLLKLENTVSIRNLMRDGRLGVVFIDTAEPSEADNSLMASLTEGVQAGYSPNRGADFDLRFQPSIYLLDANGNIVVKNVDLATAFSSIVPPQSNSQTQTDE